MKPRMEMNSREIKFSGTFFVLGFVARRRDVITVVGFTGIEARIAPLG